MPLGKCLVFHLKYWSEMKHLYLDEKPLEGIEQPEETIRMVREVGDKSKNEAVDFLEKRCGQAISDHLDKNGGKCEMLDSRVKIERHWTITYGIAPKRRIVRTGNWKMKVGLTMKREKNELVMWVWRLEDRNAPAMMAHLRQHRSGLSEDPEDTSDTIVLSRTGILPANQDALDVDEGHLLEQVKKGIQPFTAQVLEMVYPH